MAFTGMTFRNETSIADQLMTVRSTFGGAGLGNGAGIERFDMKASMKRLHAPTYGYLVDRMSSVSAASMAARTRARWHAWRRCRPT